MYTATPWPMGLNKICAAVAWLTCSNKATQVGQQTKIKIDWAWMGMDKIIHGHSLAGALKAKLHTHRH